MFDTHFHIIDMRYPVQDNQGFLPPSFPAPDYQQRTAGLGMSDEGLPTLVKLAEKGMMVKATGFGRMTLDPVKGIRALIAANPDGLMFGTDLPSQRARRAFLPSDIDRLRDNIDASLVRKVFFDNAVKFYRPRQMPVHGLIK